ncbi:MAG: DUF2283 domain-containing protein [Chloroflexaceae bacterium]|nr:DUF2283 domain-containing protein [Chloroflexaceae bacterium]
MSEPLYTYDEESDTLSIAFLPAEKATGFELTDHIILHINKTTQRLVRITLLDYSILVQQTEFGPRTFPLTGLASLSEDMRTMILDILRQKPVNDILHIAAYTPQNAQIIPTVLVQSVLTSSEAA